MDTTRRRLVAFSIRGPISRDDLPGLCARVCSILDRRSAGAVLCDVRGVEPDVVTVDALARLQLAASRHRCRVRLRNASAELLELVAFMGLADVLPDWGDARGLDDPGSCKSPSMGDYTQTNLAQVEDAAVKGGFADSQEAHFAGDDLDLETLGISYQVVKPGKHHAFGHRHREVEEVYVVVAGHGTCHLDDERVDVTRLDAIRVGPQVARGFEAGGDGLELIVFSRKAPGDAEIVEGFFDR
jgi:mannose-6-phosphate isomerase-like protein (cupin superfamily)